MANHCFKLSWGAALKHMRELCVPLYCGANGHNDVRSCLPYPGAVELSVSYRAGSLELWGVGKQCILGYWRIGTHSQMLSVTIQALHVVEQNVAL